MSEINQNHVKIIYIVTGDIINKRVPQLTCHRLRSAAWLLLHPVVRATSPESF